MAIPQPGTESLVSNREIMESPGSDISTDSTDSSSADSTSADSTPAQAISSMSENQNLSTMDKTTIIDNDDSESDISMSADSDDEEREDTDVVPPQVTESLQAPASTTIEILDTTEETSKKRKFSDAEDTAHGIDHYEVGFEVRKRLKPDTALQRHWTAEGSLQEDRSLLPAEIWHHIFTFCPPRVLGILLQVNKSFNAYLDPSSSGSSYEPLSISATKVLTPVSIWRASRSLYNLPTLPNPLLGKSELDMWKLSCSTKCQFCGKKRQPNSAPIDSWHPGPGENGVSPIWSFEIRACGPCLQKQSMKVGRGSSLYSLIVTDCGSGNRFTSILLYSLAFTSCSTIHLPYQRASRYSLSYATKRATTTNRRTSYKALF